LGGSKGSLWKKIRNVFIIFLVSGFWHGANWTFIVWGGLNALYFLPLLLRNKNRSYIEIIGANKSIPPLREIIGVFITFGLTVIAWVFFRAETVRHAMSYLGKIFSDSLFSIPEFRPRNLIVLIVLFMVIEWLGRKNEFAISRPKLPKVVEWFFYYAIVMVIYFYGRFGENIEFIYFQF
jgi:D-alanyl-lipoteichoic acid acyltransferase DltB (MBOAT superfamily)